MKLLLVTLLACVVLALPASADADSQRASGSCACTPGVSCRAVELAAGDAFDLTDVAIASSAFSPATTVPITVSVSESLGGSSPKLVFTVAPGATVTQFYLTSVRFGGAGLGVYGSCFAQGVDPASAIVTVSGIKTTP